MKIYEDNGLTRVLLLREVGAYPLGRVSLALVVELRREVVETDVRVPLRHLNDENRAQNGKKREKKRF